MMLSGWLFDVLQLDKRIEGMTVIIDMDKVGPSLLWGPGEILANIAF